MEKKIIALAVALAAAGANAATLYDNEQSKLAVKGEIDAYLSTVEVEGTSSDYDLDPDIDLWAKIQVDAEHKLNSGIKVFGSFEIENGVGFDKGDGDNKDVTTDDEYIGAMLTESFGIAVGEIGDFGDSLDAITIDNTNEGFGFVDDVVTSFESKGHTMSMKYDAEGLKLIADMYMAEEEERDAAYGLSASYDIAGFNLGASYQDHGNREAYDAINTGDNDVYGFKAGYSAGAFSIAAHYVVEQINSVDHEGVGIAADYTIDALRLYTSAFTAEKDNSAANEDDMTAYTLGFDYAIADNLTGFAEYSFADNYEYSKDAEKTIAVAGVYFTF